MNLIRHDYQPVHREALLITPNTRFQRDSSSGWGKYPAKVCGKRHKNCFAVALIVWKMTAIFVDSLHL